MACRRSASVPTLCSPERGRAGRLRRKGGWGEGLTLLLPRCGLSAGSRGRVGSSAGPEKGSSPFWRVACFAPSRPRPFPSWFPLPFALLQRALSLVRLCARQQLHRSEPTVRTGFLIDGQVGWNKGGSSEWDWAPVRDHTALILDL